MQEFVKRPWGGFQVTDAGDGWTTKRLCVEPGQRLSLQFHNKRAEVWVLVEGDAIAVVGDREFHMEIGKPVCIETGQKHRLIGGSERAIICETWIGVCDEQDIVRLQDDHGRIPAAVPV